MKSKAVGFSIRCPNCFEWSTWQSAAVENYVVDPAQESRKIVSGLRSDPDHFNHPKLLRCQQKTKTCQAPFEAFIFRNRSDAHTFIHRVPSWLTKRAFRLPKADQFSRWKQYSVAAFYPGSVERQKHIELDKLLDKELLARAIVGISAELKSPVTVYTATTFENGRHCNKYWVPIEAFSETHSIIPPRFNPFCNYCRQTTLKTIVDKARAFSVSRCPLNFGKDGKCVGREPACVVRDWNRCPAFLEARLKECPCYQNDCRMINKLERSWRAGKSITLREKTSHCWAGLGEMAIPIIVHDHLVAVATSGQYAVGSNRTPHPNKLVQNHPVLKPERNKLLAAWEIMNRSRRPSTDDESKVASFVISKREYLKRVAMLTEDINAIQSVANGRYRDGRWRAEVAFKNEMLGRIREIKARPSLISSAVNSIVERMREFWAFKATYLFEHNNVTKAVKLIGFALKGSPRKDFGLEQHTVGRIEGVFSQMDPLPYLQNRSEGKPPDNPWVASFCKLMTSSRRIPLPEGSHYFYVFVPYAEKTFVFVLAARDENDISALRQLNAADVSLVCQDAILETCTEVIQHVGEVSYKEIAESKIRVDAWHKLSRWTSHLIHGRTFVAKSALERLQQLQEFTREQALCVKFLKGAIQEISRVCHVFRAFSTPSLPQLKSVCVTQLIRNVVKPFKFAARTRSFNVTISGCLPNCKWDKVQMSSALEQLLHNAIQNSSAGANIKVCAINDKVSESVRIDVFNTGCGVPAELKRRIFENFTTRGDGTGIGLVNVKEIVESHKGHIYENGKCGENANFVLVVPTNPKIESNICKSS